MTKNVLITEPNAFHIGWLGATRRLFHLADAFHKLGFNVALLAGKMTNVPLQTKIDNRFPGLVIRTNHTGAYPRLVDIGPITRRAWRGFWRVRGADYYLTRLSFGFAETLDIDHVVKELERHDLRPNVVWGISAGYLDGAIAADRLAKAFRIPWIFELQDPPYGCGLGLKIAVIRSEVSRLLKASSRQIVVTESYHNELLTEFTLDPKYIRTIYLTYEGELVEESNSSQNVKCRMLYAGSLQGGRSLAPLLYGLCKAMDREPRMRGSLIIQIVGMGDGLEEGREVSKELGVLESIRFLGYLDRDQTEELTKQANALIVVQTPETSTFQVPGKIFGYMRLGKPILGIMPDCEAADILHKSSLGFIHSPEDIEGIADTIIGLWLDWKEARPSAKTNLDYVSQFSVEYLPQILRPVLEGLL